jgi:hypothetical protein
MYMGKKVDTPKLIKYLSDKWQGKPCPMCGHAGWSVQDYVFELSVFQRGGLVVGGGPLVPVVPVFCDNCGNTVLVNAISAGVVEREIKDG